jgi:hypothetical protein
MMRQTRNARMKNGVRIAYQVFGHDERDLLYVPGLITTWNFRRDR